LFHRRYVHSTDSTSETRQWTRSRLEGPATGHRYLGGTGRR